MSDYTKITNFTAKDALPAGNPSKKVLGSLFDAEYNAIATAITSKANKVSPNLVTPEIQSADANYDYVFSPGTLTADRTVSLPVLTGGDTFVFEAHTATLTNKTLNMSSNTITGTAAQFDTAVSDDNILFVSDLIDDDTFATATATNIPSAESVKAYVDTATSGLGGGTVDTSGVPVLLDYARFTDANTIEGRSYTEMRSDLGLVIGTDVQAYDADLTTLGGLAKTDGNFIVGNGSSWVAESGDTAIASLGITATGSELNLIDGSIAGTIVNSKAVVYGASGEVNATTLQIAGTSITSTATQLNYLSSASGTTGTGSVVFGTSPAISNPTITGTILEDVYAWGTTTGANTTDLDPANGSIHTVTLTGNITSLTDNLSAGEGITLMINDGTSYTITWPTMTWVNNGGAAPTLAATGYTVVALWKVSTTLYGALVGDGT